MEWDDDQSFNVDYLNGCIHFADDRCLALLVELTRSLNIEVKLGR